MTQEEKAKRYDEAISIAKEYDFSLTGVCAGDVIQDIFPELAESEDERIRKELIAEVKEQIDCIPAPDCRDKEDEKALKQLNKWVAWLEKQKTSEEALQYLRENHSPSEMSDFQAAMNIAVAKAYDKGYNDGLKKQGEQNQWDSVKPVSEEDKLYLMPDEQKPAETVKWSPQEESCICQLESLVKEQWRQADKVHNSVNIKKMSELMFFLKTLNPNKKPQRIISAEAKEAMYDKPAWSEEDEKRLRTIISDGIRGAEFDTPQIDWLKSIKGRVQPQNLIITDDELAQAKKDAYNDALNKIEYHSGEPTFDDGWSAAIWYFKKRNMQPQPKMKVVYGGSVD